MEKIKERIFTILEEIQINIKEDHNHDLFVLNNLIVEREKLIKLENYEKIKHHIAEIKKVFSSSSMNSLHKNALEKQKWPLLNFIRQLLRIYNFEMIPIRKSNGYSKEGKKQYKRFFKIKLKHSSQPHSQIPS